MKWIRVKRAQPCPICERPDWCSVSEDGKTICCMRTESAKECNSGGWFHVLGEPVKYKPAIKKHQVKPVLDFIQAATQYVENMTGCGSLAKELGVSIRSLERLDVGWNGQGYTFPMRDGRERIIGIRIRSSRGKWAVKGSRNGIFWPERVYSGSDWSLVICEGPTDCAALLDMGFDAVGRPSCLGGVDYVVDFLKGRRRDVIIMADKDEAKERPDGSVWYPGQEGAARLSKVILPIVRSLRVVKPPFHKDIREWYRAGATREVVESIINNTRYVA